MSDAVLSAAGPLVSIVVPLADDGDDGSQRVSSAKAQTWPHCETVAVCTKHDTGMAGAVFASGANLAEALNAGIAASGGEYVCLILPGVRYAADKVARQLAFMRRFELEQAVVFSNHAQYSGPRGRPRQVELPPVDPSDMFTRLCCGLALDYSSLMFPRTVFDRYGRFDDHLAAAAVHGFFTSLSRQLPFVGMAECLVEAGHSAPGHAPAATWREVHARLLAQLLAAGDSAQNAGRLTALLGEAAQSRLSAGQPGAAWDALRAALRLPRTGGAPRNAAGAFARPLLRAALRQLPVRWAQILRGLRAPAAHPATARLDFSAIYRVNGFGGTESLSGMGSTLFQTRIVRRELPALLQRLDVRSMLDVPCGDFHWMREVDLAGIHYTGGDLVEAMVHENQRRFGAAQRAFRTINLLTDPLPATDLVLCRDCLVHLPFDDALAAIDNIRRSTSTWLLTTTFTSNTDNRELGADGWRALNLCLPPFDFPEPDMLLIEKCTEAGGLAGDKALGLWRIADLPQRPVP